MKSGFLLLCSLCLAQSARLQPPPTNIFHYVIPQNTAEEKVLVMKMPFGSYKPEIIIGDTIALKQAGHLLIDVICTDYPAEQSLNTLNANRIKEFYRTFPFVNPAQVAGISYFRQKEGAEKEKAQPMFHGVVVRYRLAQNSETIKNELAKLEAILATPAPPALKPSLRDDGFPAIPAMRPREKRTVDSTGKPLYYDPSMSLKGKKITFIIGDENELRNRFSIPDSQVIVDFKTAWKKDLITKRVYQQFKDKPHSYLTLYEPLPEAQADFIPRAVKDSIISAHPVKLPDSTLIEVLKRNHWQNIAVTGDVTASMYPYTGQLLWWIRLHSLDSFSRRFSFFNDGDDQEDEQKKPAETGGIYSAVCRDFDEVKALVTKTMNRGAGGDLAENVIEALLQGEKRFPEAACQVLIADNWAPVRDKELLNRLTKPVRIILCAVRNDDVNIDYLNIALKTKGSVHLMQQDFNTIPLMQEGAVLNIGRKTFRIKAGEFVE